MQVTVNIPEEFAPLLVPEGVDASRKLLEDTVAEAYRQRRLTMEQVRQILGFATRMQVDPFLQRYKIYDFTVEDLESDLATMKAWMKERESQKSQ
ncbi:MAG TPA: UPF0175 family protein [Terracidiphilus sp.]|nr:UPF0175 family protein [Terracidiphilus sp.]